MMENKTVTTKKKAQEIASKYYAILHWLNGGTSEENKRSAPHCYKRLKEQADLAKLAIQNPGKRLCEDSRLWNVLSESIPMNLKKFREKYEKEISCDQN